MPLYYYHCVTCGADITHLSRSGPTTPACCGGLVVRAPKPPTTQVVERLDNGLMVKALERPADVTRLLEERRQADRKKQEEP